MVILSHGRMTFKMQLGRIHNGVIAGWTFCRRWKGGVDSSMCGAWRLSVQHFHCQRLFRLSVVATEIDTHLNLSLTLSGIM